MHLHMDKFQITLPKNWNFRKIELTIENQCRTNNYSSEKSSVKEFSAGNKFHNFYLIQKFIALVWRRFKLLVEYRRSHDTFH